MKTPRNLCFSGLALLLTMPLTFAATTTWDAGAAPDTNWSANGNWSGDVSPFGNDVVIGAAGSGTSASTATNTVNVSGTVTNLLYQYDSATNSQVTQIDSGSTLTVTGTAGVLFTVGGYFQNASATTKTVVTGGGTLAINGSSKSVSIRNTGTGAAPGGAAELDMRGLANFSAQLGTGGNIFAVGGSDFASTTTVQRTTSTVYLADSNVITAANLHVQSLNAGGDPTLTFGSGTSTLYLGRENILNTDRIRIGVVRGTGNGAMRFDPGVLGDAPTVKLRASNGTSAVVDFYIGANVGATSGGLAQTGEVDFTGGAVDALISNLYIGSGQGHDVGGRAKGTLTMDQGVMTVGNAIVGQKASTGSFVAATIPNEGILNVNGGTFIATNLTLANRVNGEQGATGTLNISGNAVVTGSNGIVMGNRAAGSGTAALTATVNLSGGTLTVGGNIAQGTEPSVITSTVNLTGGTLEMNGHNISVDTFNAQNGTLRNLGQLNGGGTFAKSGTGALAVQGVNTWTGATAVNAGTLLISGTHSGGGAYTINDGGTLGGSGTIITAGNAGITLAAGGQLAPGNSPGNLTLDLGDGVLDISAGIAAAGTEALVFELGTASDRISLTGTLQIGSGLLEFDDFVFSGIAGFGPGVYTLFSTDNAISGSLGALLTGTVGAYDAEIGFANGGQDLVLNVVPEPSAFALMLMACGVGIWGLRRRAQLGA